MFWASGEFASERDISRRCWLVPCVPSAIITSHAFRVCLTTILHSVASTTCPLAASYRHYGSADLANRLVMKQSNPTVLYSNYAAFNARHETLLHPITRRYQPDVPCWYCGSRHLPCFPAQVGISHPADGPVGPTLPDDRVKSTWCTISPDFIV